jgi:hypothetical protein
LASGEVVASTRIRLAVSRAAKSMAVLHTWCSAERF